MSLSELPHWTIDSWDTERWPNFAFHELKCKTSGDNRMDPQTMDRLQSLRLALGAPMVITSGYRSLVHPAELHKPRPGPHAYGRAVDIRTFGTMAYDLIELAPAFGFTGIGVNQKGDGRFIHLDDLDPEPGKILRPAVWSY